MPTLPKQFICASELSGLPADTPILVAFSGGADSSALLHMLAHEAKETGAVVFAAHVNHGIRGEEADRDEEFCRQTADALGVRLFVLHADVPNEARATGESIETAARRIRYDYFNRLMLDQNIPLLATAHNANDNLETMLFHLTRGSGLSGLCGIPISRVCAGGCIVRPLLGMTRAEILSYCNTHEISYVNDSTNVNTEYTRNRIRSEVIPALTAIHPSAVENSVRLAEHLRADALCLDGMAKQFLTEARRDCAIACEKILCAPSAISHRALMLLYREFSGGTALEYAHLQAMRRLAERAVPHSSISLPHGISAVIEDGWLYLQSKTAPLSYEPYEIPLTQPKTLISQTKCEIVIEPSQTAKNIYKTSIQFSLNSATIKGMLFVRNRREGDRILLGGMHKSLKKLFCEKKIPPELRARLPILCDGDGILAVPMLGIRDGAKAKDPFEQSLTITFNFFE